MTTDEMKRIYNEMMHWTGVAHDAYSSDIAAYRAANARADELYFELAAICDDATWEAVWHTGWEEEIRKYT